VETPKSIALFDFSHALNVAYNAVGPDQAGTVLLEQLAAARASCEHVILCLDTKPYWRTQTFDGYKAGRKTEPELAAIWDRCMQRVTDEGYQMARAPGEEADDVMATLAAVYAEEFDCKDIRLITADKDVAQCLTPRVRWFVPQLGNRGEFEIRDEAWVPKHFDNVDWEKEKKQGPQAKDIAMVLAIMGDTSDKIPGVKGIGVKGAVGLVNTFGTPEKMAQGLIAEQNACKMKGKDLSAFWRNFAAGMAEIPKWLKLTTLNHNVQLERPAASYLERLPSVAQLESEADGFPDLEGAELGDAWEPSSDGAPTAEELEEERLAMDAERQALAASLPVGPGDGMSSARLDAMGYPPQAPVETRSAADRQVEYARNMTPADHAALAEKRAVEMAAHDPSKMIVGKDPKADAVLAELAAKSSAGASSASISASSGAHPTGSTPPAGGGSSTVPSPQAQPTSPSTAAAPSGAGAASSPPAATPPAPAPQSDSRISGGESQVVPPSVGPQRSRKEDEFPEPPMAAIVPFAHPTWALALQPSSAGHAFIVAKKLWATQLYIRSYKNFHELWAIILRGRELGVGMTTALDSIHIIEGKPHSSAMLISALAEGDPNHEYSMMVELTDKRAIVEIKHARAPKATPWEYTIGEAEALGLLEPSKRTGKKSQWVLRPKTMLLKSAKVIGHRFQFARSCLGLHAFEMNPETIHLAEENG
jgi:5'-3' exonuclease